MPKPLCQAVAVTLATTLGTAATASGATAAELTIIVSGVGSGAGRVYVALYREKPGIDFPSEAGMVAGVWRQARKGGFRITLTGLPAGRYAVNGFHDTNGNGKLDTNLMGLPTEGYGFGNGARSRFGPPTFKAASVSVSPEATTVELPIEYPAR